MGAIVAVWSMGGHCGDAWQLFLCHNFSLILLDYSSDASVVSHHTVGDCSRLRERCLHVSIDLQLLRAIDHHMWTRVRVAVSMKRAPVCNGCRYFVYCSVNGRRAQIVLKSCGNLKILKSCEHASPFEMRQLVALLPLLWRLRSRLMSDICATGTFC